MIDKVIEELQREESTEEANSLEEVGTSRTLQMTNEMLSTRYVFCP